jgi:hypothetical protein
VGHSQTYKLFRPRHVVSFAKHSYCVMRARWCKAAIRREWVDEGLWSATSLVDDTLRQETQKTMLMELSDIGLRWTLESIRSWASQFSQQVSKWRVISGRSRYDQNNPLNCLMMANCVSGEDPLDKNCVGQHWTVVKGLSAFSNWRSKCLSNSLLSNAKL